MSPKFHRIFHQIAKASKFYIYLYIYLCLNFKLQYVGKLEAQFNVRLNNHRKNVSMEDSIPAPIYIFIIEGHDFKVM